MDRHKFDINIDKIEKRLYKDKSLKVKDMDNELKEIVHFLKDLKDIMNVACVPIKKEDILEYQNESWFKDEVIEVPNQPLMCFVPIKRIMK